MNSLVATLVSWGPGGVLLLALIDSAGIPIPGGVDVLVTVVATLSARSGYLGALFATLGSLLGSLVLYYIGRRGGQAYLERHTSSERGAKFRCWFLRYGLITVFIPALLPIPLPLKVFILCAGAFGVRTRSFVLVLLAARIPRYFGLAFLGVKLGEHSMAWLLAHKTSISLLSIALFVALYLLVRVSDRQRQAQLQ